MSARLRIRGGKEPLRGRTSVPGDKSIGHRALIFASLARGRCTIEGLSGGEDNAATAEAFAQMGVKIERTQSRAGERAVIEGVGLTGLAMPSGVIDCGNSGTTMRLMAGLLSAQRFGTRLTGDASLSRRPMGRVIGPLRARGAHVAGHPKRPDGTGKDDEHYPPLSVAPLVEGEALQGIEYDMPVASAQVKSCLLLGGLYAAGPTILREPVLSRDHTERMMVSLGVPLRTEGSAVLLDPSAENWSRGWAPFDWEVPGDLSSAAFLLAAAHARPGSRVVIEGVGVNPTRTGVIDLLRLMGAGVPHQTRSEGAGGEPRADLEVVQSGLRGTVLGGELLVRMIDEVPAACVLAAVAAGTTEIRDAAELRVKESDRIAAMASVLDAFGVPAEELPDGLRIHGGAPLRSARVESQGDHRIAMAAAVLALAADGESVIEDAGCVATSFPGFAECIRGLGADATLEEA